MVTFLRILKNTFQHLQRNPWHALTAVFVMSLTFLILGVFVLVGLGSNQVLQNLEKQPQVTVFFDYEKTPEEHVLQVKQELEKWDRVESVRYVSREEGVRLLQEFAGGDEQVQQFVSPEILPPVLEVSAAHIRFLPEIAQRVQQDSFVWKVQLQQEVADKLRLGALTLRLAGLGLASLLFLVSVLVILVVVSGSIGSFSREVEVMKLVGATAWYVRWPFILEGVLYGVSAAVLAVGLLWAGLGLVQGRGQFLEDYFRVDFFPVPVLLLVKLWLAMAAVGVALGITGSLLAINRHLRT